MRGSGGNVNRLLPGVEVQVGDGKEGAAGREKRLELLRTRDVRLVAIERVLTMREREACL